MIKQEIEIVVLAANLEPILLAEEGEPSPQLDEELTDVGHEPPFEFPFLRFLRDRQEAELVRILQRLPGEVGLKSRECLLEVRLRLALALVEVALDPVNEDGPAPAVLEGGPGVPEPLPEVLDLLDQDDVLSPGKFCDGQRESGVGDLSHKLWDDFLSSLVGEEGKSARIR